LFVGAPGRGKTTIATLMGVLAGEPLSSVRRHTQHGHPQLTIADLLGGPLPRDLVEAQDARHIRVGWRGWITQRVKIIDEYNRIPTKTQSALLSLMSEGYAESFEQTIEAGPSSWYLTANDELGGGTFQVIEALRDRIDVVVRAPLFHESQVTRLAERARGGTGPEERVPDDIKLTRADLDVLLQRVREVEVPAAVVAALGTFSAQLEFCRRASPHIEGMSKDTLHIAGARLAIVCNEDCPLDKGEHLCTQTENGVSARALTATLTFARALAAFHGRVEVTIDDIATILPFTLLERLKPNPSSPFFGKAEHAAFAFDRVAWIRQLIDRSLRQQAASQVARHAAGGVVVAAALDLDTAAAPVVRERMRSVEAALTSSLQRQELNALVHLDLTNLKAAHVKLRSRLAALEGRTA
jgi:MoxR-like ATPase